MNDNKTNVEALGMVTRFNIPVGRVLTAAIASSLTDVVVIGYDKDGDEYFASSVADGGTALWLLERAKKALLETAD